MSILGQRRAAWIGPRQGQTGEVVRIAGQRHVIVRWDSDGVETWYDSADLHIPANIYAPEEAWLAAQPEVVCDPEREAWLAEQDARGSLAFAPEELDCYECNDFNGTGTPRKVAALDKVINPADPTQTYKLACGHIAF